MSAGSDPERLLLFGDDHSTGSDAAWLWVNMQEWPGWRVEVFTAVTPPIGPPPGLERGQPHAWSPREARVAFPSTRISALAHTTADADPRYALTVREDADLMVTGASGRRGVKLGSTAEYLMHRPPTPLVIAHHATSVRTVLACVDGSPHASLALSTLADLPWARDLEAVVLLSIADKDTDPDRAIESAIPILGEIPVTTRAAGPSREHADTILEAATAEHVPMIVMGTRGLSPILRKLAGSTASAVASRSSVSVLLAHCG